MDKHYWKNAYKGLWPESAAKEKKVAVLIQEATGLTVLPIGLGAGDAAFITGSAADNQHEKGGADLFIPQSNCYLEVTGPNIRMDTEKPLWVRPDKLENTFQKLKKEKGSLHALVHVLVQLNGEPLYRVIVLNDRFFQHLYQRKSFLLVHPVIRGRRETYLEIPSNHETLVSWETFLSLLTSY